ncbi:MAG TPA: ester cyclase [Chloroflexota bacterium]|nr:ester cyclase [Chloroflexota bacterium]
MATEARALIERLFTEFWNGGTLAAADELFAPDFVVHNEAFPREAAPDPSMQRGPQFMKTSWQAIHAAFPDLRFRYDDVTVEGDRAACRWTSQGTHRGEFAGIAATGHRVSYSGITLFHLGDGQFSEAWVADNTLALIQELRAASGTTHPR